MSYLIELSIPREGTPGKGGRGQHLQAVNVSYLGFLMHECWGTVFGIRYRRWKASSAVLFKEGED